MTQPRRKPLLATRIRVTVATLSSIIAFLCLPYLHYAKQTFGFVAGNAGLSAKLYEFRLKPTSRSRGVSGTGYLRIAPSPFDVAVTPSGKLIYNLELSINGLLPASSLGAYTTYVVWITTPKLDRTEKLGALKENSTFKATISSMNKFILIVTAEASAEVEKRSGPVVLRGFSPSGLLDAFQNHELFNNMPH